MSEGGMEHRMNRLGGRCPVCGDDYNLAIGPASKVTSPDEGEWCFGGGTLYIHEEFRYENTDTDHERGKL